MKRILRSKSVSNLDDKSLDERTSSALGSDKLEKSSVADERSIQDEELISDLEREASLTSRELYQETIEEPRPGISREVTLPAQVETPDVVQNASLPRQVNSPIGIKMPMVKIHEPVAKRTSYAILPNEHLLNSFDRAKTRSANGIRVGVKRKVDTNPTVRKETIPDSYQYKEEEKKDTEIIEYENLISLFNGTEQQVLYRINMLIHQHTDLNKLQRDVDGFGILHHAVINKFVTVAEKLIENGATMLDNDNNDDTPLHYALGLNTLTEQDQEEKDRLEKEKTEKKKTSKCDEMASLLISKIKPFRVREIFGDDKDRDDFINNEDENAKRSVTIGASSAPENTQERTRSIKQESKDPKAVEKCLKLPKLFDFMDVVKDKELKETARTILDKMEDVDPVKSGEACVYTRLLLEEKTNANGDKNKQTKQSGAFRNAFHYISKHSHDLANHPVYRAVIEDKWDKWAFRSYLFDTILYFLSFIALTICTVVGAQSDGVFIYDSAWQYTRLALEILMCLFILRVLYTETLQLLVDLKDYVKSIMNWVELGSAIILIVEIILRAVDKNAHWFVFAIGYVLWTVKGLKYAAVTRHTAAYSETLRVIMIRDFWLFALFFVALEMVFGGTYLLVLKGTNSLDISPDTTTILGIYYVGLRTMIETGFPIEEYDSFPKAVQAVIIVFMALTIVVMLNILIAQLSNTYETAYAEGQIKSWINRADAIVNFELEDNLKDKIPSGYCLIRHLCFRNGNRKKEDDKKYKLPFNKEELLEEKEKMDEMRSTLKQLDSKLIHADLTIQTIKTRQNVLLQTVRGQTGDTYVGQAIGNMSNDNFHDTFFKEMGDMKTEMRELKNILVQIAQK